MTKAVKIAVLVEKNKPLCKKITNHIKSNYTLKITECTSPNSAFRAVTLSNKPGVLIIGNNHKPDNFSSLIRFCSIRLTNWTIIVIDHLNSDESAAQAFSIGADDVLRVPFSIQELAARLKLRLIQSTHPQSDNSLIVDNTLAKVELTRTELAIMHILIAHKDKIVTRNQLAQHLDNQDWVYGDRKYDVHITNIRKKLQKNSGSKYVVKSVRSTGYYVQEINDDDDIA